MTRIYHYTGIESLSLILKTHKLRFSRLDGVDDVKEAQRHAGINFGKFFFVSCWTQQAEESIPQWSMYGSGMQGVRIEMPSYPFTDQALRPKAGLEGISVYGERVGPLGFDSLWGDGYFIMPLFLQREHFAGPVDYVDNVEKQYAKAIKREINPGGKVSLKIDGLPFLPRKKSRDWAFQKEYRFSLFVLPSLPIPGDGLRKADFFDQVGQHMSDSFINNIDPGINYIDLPLSDDSFKNLVVRTGPLITPGGLTCVEAVVQTFAPKAKIEKSSFSGSIRVK